MRERDQTVNVVGNDKSILLQTANVFVTDEKERKSKPIKALLDSCSQQTYITQNLVNHLNLQPIRELNMKVKAFGNEEGKNMRLKEYQVVIKPIDMCNSIYVKAIAVPNICAPVKSAVIEHRFLGTLKLADKGNSMYSPIDLLIGADSYWKIVDGKLKRDDQSGLVAISSMFGWLINGPIKNEVPFKSVNLVTSHVMKVQCETKDDKVLSQEINRFWDLDVLGISDNETSVYQKFNENIKFENSRYVIKLPFKETHPILPDNYGLCKKRLFSLKSRLDKDVEMKKRYDSVFQEQLECGIIEKVNDPGTLGGVTYLTAQLLMKINHQRS